MSKTSDLTKRIRDKQQSDLNEIEKLQGEHEARLRQLLSDELHTIENATQDLRELAQKQLRRSVLPLAIIYGAALTGILLAVATTWYASSQASEIQKRHAKLQQVPNIQISHACNGQTCVKIKPKAGKYGKHGKWRIIQQ